MADVPAGWYPDDTGTTRWWDGQQWTAYTREPPQGTEPQGTEPQGAGGGRRPGWVALLVTGVAVLALLAVGVTVGTTALRGRGTSAASSTTSASASTETSASASASTEPSSEATASDSPSASGTPSASASGGADAATSVQQVAQQFADDFLMAETCDQSVVDAMNNLTSDSFRSGITVTCDDLGTFVENDPTLAITAEEPTDVTDTTATVRLDVVGTSDYPGDAVLSMVKDADGWRIDQLAWDASGSGSSSADAGSGVTTTATRTS